MVPRIDNILKINAQLMNHIANMEQLQHDMIKQFSKQVSNMNKNKTKTSKEEINEIYEFDRTFDGTLGEPALEFRQAVVNHVLFVQKQLPDEVEYRESRVLIRFIKALTGTAKTLYNARIGSRFTSVKQFLRWFDVTFALSTLRQDMYEDLTNWQIDAKTQDLQIVSTYLQKVELFNQTEKVSNTDILNATHLTDAKMVVSLLNAIEIARFEIFEYLDHWRRDVNVSRNPQTLKELSRLIKRAVDYILTKSVGKTRPRTDPTKLASISDKHEVNAISANELSNLGFGNSPNADIAYNNNDTKSKSRYRDWNAKVARDQNWSNKKGYGSGQNRGYNRGKGRGNGNRSRVGDSGFGRGAGRGAGRGVGRGYRRNDYNYGRSQGRGRGRGRQNWYFHSKNQNGVPVPIFKNAKCNKCGIDGHMEWQCQWIREDYPYLIESFEKMAHNTRNNKKKCVDNNNNSNNNTNNININSNTNNSNAFENNSVNAILNANKNKFYMN